MGHELALRNHPAVQHAALRATVAGGAAGLVHALCASPVADALGLLAVALAVVPPRSLAALARTSLVACAAAGVLSAAAAVGGTLHATIVGVALALAALAYATDAKGAPRRLLAWAGGAVGLAAGAFLVEGAHAGGALAGFSPALEGLCLGGGAGLLAGLGSVGRELDLVPALEAAPDERRLTGTSCAGIVPAAPVDARLPAKIEGSANEAITAPVPTSPPDGDGEILRLVARAHAVSRQTCDALGPDSRAASQAAVGLADRIAAFARRWSSIERELCGTDRAALESRRAEIEARARASTDDVTRAEYTRAERALGQQLDDLDGISRAHDRAVARLHHHVAVLERLRLAALRRRSVEADDPTGEGELGSLVEEIAAASLDLDSSAEVLELQP